MAGAVWRPGFAPGAGANYRKGFAAGMTDTEFKKIIFKQKALRGYLFES
jgi:hypothetical protein